MTQFLKEWEDFRDSQIMYITKNGNSNLSSEEDFGIQ